MKVLSFDVCQIRHEVLGLNLWMNLLLEADANAWALLIGDKESRAACRVHDLSNSLLQGIRVTKSFLLLYNLDWNSSCKLERLIHSATER